MFDDERAPHVLVTGWHIRGFGGDWLDLPAGLWNQANYALAVYDALKAYKDSDKGAKWKNEHPHEWQIVKPIMKEYTSGKKHN